MDIDKTNISNVYFSIVIPLFNKELYIANAIRSVLDQTYSNYELLIVDDGSTDQSFEIAKAFTNYKVRIIKQLNSGVSAARNRGILEAIYEYVCFLDADDEWDKNYLLEIVQLIKSYPETGFYATGYFLLYPNAVEKKYIFKKLNKNFDIGLINNYFYYRSNGDIIITASSVCIKKDIFDIVGNFVLNEKLGEDQDLWAKISLKYPLGFSNKPLVKYRYVEDSSVHTCQINRKLIHITNLENALETKNVPLDMVKDVKRFIKLELLYAVKINILKMLPENAIKIIREENLIYKYPISCLYFILCCMQKFYLKIKI